MRFPTLSDKKKRRVTPRAGGVTPVYSGFLDHLPRPAGWQIAGLSSHLNQGTL